MNAEIISIGTELLLGEIHDTNATWIAQQLKNIGLNLFYRSTVGDNLGRITDVLKLAMSRADIIITTGGLGPTIDDMTRQAVADAVGQPLDFHEDLLTQIAEKFARFNSPMSPNNRTQAMLPRGATVIDNPVGTAPSFIVETGTGAIISLPGVPREMKYLMEHAVLPYLLARIETSVIRLRVLRTAGAGESWIGEQLSDLMQLTNPTVGTAAHSGFCDVRITAKAPTDQEAIDLIAAVEADIRARVGSYIFGVDKDPLEGALIDQLTAVGGRIAISETGTNGLLHERLQTSMVVDNFGHIEQFESVTALRASLNLTSDTPLQALAESAAGRALTASTQPASVAIGIVSEPTGTAITVTTGTITRNRAYAYGGVDGGGPDWATAWGISMAWRLLSEARTQGTL